MTGYQPGTSPLHRAPTGVKFVGMLVIATGVFVLSAPTWVGGVCLLVLAGYAVARLPLRYCWRVSRSLALIALLLFAVQWWLVSLDAAWLVSLRLVAAVGVANLFTATTRVDDVVSSIERAAAPLRRFGVRPDRLGLLAGLTMQAVSTLSLIAGQVREAAKARGADRSVIAFAVPFLVRTLRHADDLGEALAARGEDDRA
ncbi:cobalt transporter [Actinosynnema sp. ALI-1.44]|uniref:energy-coupling factor transporter transmembrane component T family protein n=1 Tax=Actinosynnema sp. ALI-1.44 TaxID=1933779 RepID=UPI00097CB06C|nr:energy-coupling factor transporter transmembrane component T [Actinosynnema sp. ALI-1.44]ONI83170.1 cobalt transporter [Actinosynnema sp. ALI-1.44]